MEENRLAPFNSGSESASCSCLSVTSESMLTKYWLTLVQACPRKSVVKRTDHLAMSIAVYWDLKQQNKQTKVGKKAVNTHFDRSILIFTGPVVKTGFNWSSLVDWWSIEVVDWVN